MSQPLHIQEQAHLRKTIISQCIWSDTYSSLKHILKRTANQLPLLISFPNDDDEQQTLNDNDQTIFFFDRNVSTKLLFTPLRQLENQSDQFEVYPHHCTFAATDLFKGAFEFILDGKRCSRIFITLEELVDFATNNKCTVVFMSRDRVQGYYLNFDASNWKSKKYSQGSIFHAQCIHRSSENRKSSNDYLECLDEEGYSAYLKMSYPGRFSLIATSTDQQENHPEIYLHSTQTPNIDQLIKRLTNNNNNTDCIRLVRGPVPYNFYCQHLRLVRQHTHDVLVGITQENLVIEWNLESHAPCRYATNLNDILYKLSDGWEEQLLENYIDQARTHYRENFQFNMQLISTRDWAAFFRYWKWTGDINQIDKNISYQSRHRFHLVASIQDLSDHSETLSTELKKPTNHQHHHRKSDKKFTVSQRLFLSQMNKLLSSDEKPNRKSSRNPRTTSLLITQGETPFDNSAYESNLQPSANIPKINLSKKNARRTQ